MPESKQDTAGSVSSAWQRGLANLLAAQGVSKLSDTYSSNVVLKEQPKQQSLVKKLVKLIEKDGIKVETNADVKFPTFFSDTNKISFNGKNIPAGILAHEWGHGLFDRALKNKIGAGLTKAWNSLYSLGGASAPVALLASAGASVDGASDDTVRNVGLIGSALQVPRLIDEIAASAQGVKKLQQLNLPGKWRAFLGVPTYLLSTAAPMIPWGLRKMEPGLDNLLDKLKNKPSE